jgi:hypothetical protein
MKISIENHKKEIDVQLEEKDVWLLSWLSAKINNTSVGAHEIADTCVKAFNERYPNNGG